MKVDSIVKQLSAEHKQNINKVVGSEVNLFQGIISEYTFISRILLAIS